MPAESMECNLMPVNWLRNLFVVSSISLSSLLGACSDGEDGDNPPMPGISQNTSDQLTLTAPRTIARVCVPDVLQLGLTVTVNGDSTTIAVPGNGDGWSGIVPVEQGSTANIELNWTHNGNVPLASLKTERTINSSQTIPLDGLGYATVDSDNDGFSNIAELCASPASDYNNVTSIPTVQSVTDPVLSDITPSRLDFSANIMEATSGSIRFSNTSSSESILDYTISSDQAFPIFSQLSGKLLSGESQTITADVACSTVAGSFDATVTITTNGGAASVPVSLDCQSSGSSSNIAVLSNLTLQHLILSADTNQTTPGIILFTNTGDIPLEYVVTNNNTFFGVFPSGGSVAPGATESLTVTGQCGEDAIVRNDSFSLTGNFFAVPPIEVTLDCGGSFPSVFTEENYNLALIPIFGIINNNYLSGASSAYFQLVSAVIEDSPDPTFLTEVSRGEESVDDNGDPVYSVRYDCNAGGNVDVERQGRIFEAELFNCKLGPFVLSGKLLNSGFIESPRQFFSTFSDVSAIFPGGELTQSGSISYTSDPNRSAFRYIDIQYSYDNGSSNFAITNGSTSATVNVGVYKSEFEFDITGSVTNNRNFKVKSDSIDKIEALEGFYYSRGNFTVDEVDGDGEMKIEPGKNGSETFELGISENGSSTALSVPWSDNYYFRCGFVSPTIEASTYLCRASE